MANGRVQTATTERRFLNERDFGVFLGISPRTLQTWRLRGQGPPWRKLGGAVRYDMEGFETWAAQQPGGDRG